MSPNVETRPPLLKTKLRLPFTRPALVARPRLLARLAEGLRGPLTLIAAPAGFGKTTLAAAGVVESGLRVAWLSLDPADNQAGRFLTYVVAALQEANPAIGSEATQLLAAGQAPPPEAVLTSLINDLEDSLEDSSERVVLVLDDYQHLTSPAAHFAVQFLLEQLPASLHLLIATRSDPPLPLARLRARGQLVELRAADLRFTEAETAQFLSDVMGLHLKAEAIAALEARTEGWIAGLQMAALSLRERAEVVGFIEGFSGSHRYILDYLLDEVLNSQPPGVQRFLLWTSILERLSAPLCAALLAADEGEPADAGPRATAMLEYLERANLFLLPLDDERTWYRYHHLFADLLRLRLDPVYPGLRPRLHARAADWLEAEGLMVEAVHHALAAGEYDRAARLVEQNTWRLLAQGELSALTGWIEALPADVRLRRPWLCVHQAYALAFAGRLAEIPALLAQAEAAPDAAAEAVAAGPELAGAVAAVRAMTAVMAGQDAEALAQAQRATDLLPPENLWDRATAAWALGFAQRSLGRLPEARLAFEEQARLGRALGNIWTLVTGLTDQAQVLRAQGQLRAARSLFEQALAEAATQGARSRGYIARMEAGLAGVLYEQNELEPARRLLEEAVAHSRQWPNPNHLAYAFCIQARVRLAQGDLAGARASMEDAWKVLQTAPLTRVNRRMVEVDWVRVWLAHLQAGATPHPGDPLAERAGELIARWRVELGDVLRIDELEGKRLDESAGLAALMLAQLALFSGETDEAQRLVERIKESARSAGHWDGVLRAQVLAALAHQAGQVEAAGGAALAALEEALTLGEAGGYVRLFVDAGPPFRRMLSRWLAQAHPGPLQTYAQNLLVQLDAGQVSGEKHTPVPERSAALDRLIEPLSRREIEVLRLMARGASNQEIAAQLTVAPGTVKAHTASIYRKLDVANRTEAAARARELGLLA